jgi:hypothetical protein
VAYKERLERLSMTIPCRIDRVRGNGVRADIAIKEGDRNRFEGKVFAAGRPYQKPEEFLQSYAEDIGALPEPYRHAVTYLDGLGAHEKDVWTTMLPAAAAFRREAGDSPPDPCELLIQTRSWCTTEVLEQLSRT